MRLAQQTTIQISHNTRSSFLLAPVHKDRIEPLSFHLKTVNFRNNVQFAQVKLDHKWEWGKILFVRSGEAWCGPLWGCQARGSPSKAARQDEGQPGEVSSSFVQSKKAQELQQFFLTQACWILFRGKRKLKAVSQIMYCPSPLFCVLIQCKRFELHLVIYLLIWFNNILSNTQF